MKKNILLIVLSVLLLVLDQVTKILVTTNISVDGEVVLIKNFLSMINLHNTGIAFGMFGGGRVIIVGVSIVIFMLLISEFKRYKEYKLMLVSFALIIGGLFGNLIDRVALGYVRDFISFKFLGLNIPVFNFSDICICIGAVLFIIKFILLEVKSGNKNSKRNGK